MTRNIWRTLADLWDRGTPCAVATVVDVQGSGPRHGGAKMVVFADGSIQGTVGGGALEKRVIQVALEQITSGETRLWDWRLKSDLGMECGGAVQVFVEPLVAPPRLYIFGAGHVGQAVCAIGAKLGFSVTVFDLRPEFANAERFPDATAFCHHLDPAQWGDFRFDQRTYCVVLTHSHQHDAAVVQALMQQDPAYVGMIGSRKKGKKIREQLLAAGVSGEKMGRLFSPVGLAIGAETPEEIAVSIAAELVAVRNGQPLPAARSMRDEPAPKSTAQ